MNMTFSFYPGFLFFSVGSPTQLRQLRLKSPLIDFGI